MADESRNSDDYNIEYRAVKDTEWMDNPMAHKPRRGKVEKGTIVYFDRIEPIPPTWQLAKFENGSLLYVHIEDYEPA